MRYKSQKDIDEMEKKSLQETLEHYKNENQKIKQQIDAMSKTSKNTKMQLQEFLNKITDRETAVQKLNFIIEEYNQKLNNFSSIQNKLKSPFSPQNINNSIYNNNSSPFDHTPMSVRNRDIKILPYQNPFDIDKYKDYCAKQSMILKEISNLRYEINSLSKRNKDSNVKIIDQKKINLLDCFETESVIKLAVSLKTTEMSKLYIVDKNKTVWAMIRRKDLNENSINNPQMIESRKEDYFNGDNTQNIDSYIKSHDHKEQYRVYDNNNNEYDGERQSIIAMTMDPNNFFF